MTRVLYVEHDDDNLYMLKMRLEQVSDFAGLLFLGRALGRRHPGFQDDPKDLLAGLSHAVRAGSERPRGSSGSTTADVVVSFDTYVNRLDELSAEKLRADYESVRRGAVNAAQPNLRHGAQSLMVILLGEMIRREGTADNKSDMRGCERALQMLNRLNRAVRRPAGRRYCSDFRTIKVSRTCRTAQSGWSCYAA